MKPADSKDEKPTKKPYRSPVLEVYGDIRSLTRFIAGGMGKNDMVTGPEKTGA